jgi:hypothetical protein
MAGTCRQRQSGNMSPTSLLVLALTLTALAYSWRAVAVGRYQHRVAKLAERWRMHYAAADRFRLSDRVAERLAVPGAAQVRVSDLIYGNEEDRYRYVFLVAYTEGVARQKVRSRRVGTLCEPKDRTGPANWTPLVLAPEGLTILEQYEHLRETEFPAAEK